MVRGRRGTTKDQILSIEEELASKLGSAERHWTSMLNAYLEKTIEAKHLIQAADHLDSTQNALIDYKTKDIIRGWPATDNSDIDPILWQRYLAQRQCVLDMLSLKLGRPCT